MNESTKRLEADDFESSEELCMKYPTEYRRNKIDISSGYTDLKAGKTDSYVRDFIDKLKEINLTMLTCQPQPSEQFSQPHLLR